MHGYYWSSMKIQHKFHTNLTWILNTDDSFNFKATSSSFVLAQISKGQKHPDSKSKKITVNKTASCTTLQPNERESQSIRTDLERSNWQLLVWYVTNKKIVRNTYAEVNNNSISARVVQCSRHNDKMII